MPSASWTTARPLPASGRAVKTSSQVSGAWPLRSRSRAAASARTRAGRARASPGGTPASPRARPRLGLVVGGTTSSAGGAAGSRGLGLRGRLGRPWRPRPPRARTGAWAARLGRRLRRGRRRLGRRARGSGSGSGSTWWIGASRRSSAVTSSRSPSSSRSDRRLGRLGGHGLVDRGGRRVARAGPSASCSRRATSPGSAPWRRLSSRCSGSRRRAVPWRPNPSDAGRDYSRGEASARTVRFLPARLAR